MQSKEMENLSKRNQELYDQYTRIDIECNRVSEDLLAATNMIEQLRNETANLRAEKQLASSAQAQLLEANQNLQRERLQLTDLLSNVQKMNASLEGAERGERSRLESEVRLLEQQT